MSVSNKMTKEKFDLLIKENLIKSGASENEFTYRFGEIRKYSEYYSDTEFNRFIDEMKENYPQHYRKFINGAGGELKKKNSRYGMMPPKMASVASSSRFCYLALRDGINITYKNIEICSNNVEFEKECKILSDSRTAPQLDAFISDGNIYVEAKCHEIFDSHKPKFKNKYWKVFENDDAFSKILPEAEKGEDEFVLPLSVFNISKTPNRFDIKQFVCHLFGIANQNLNKEAKLMYLFFIPTTDDVNETQQLEEIFQDLTEEIKAIFQCDVIKSFCKNHNIKLIAIAEKAEIMQPINNKNKYTIYWEE